MNNSTSYLYLGIAIFILIYMTKSVLYIGFAILIALFLYKYQSKYKKWQQRRSYNKRRCASNKTAY